MLFLLWRGYIEKLFLYIPLFVGFGMVFGMVICCFGVVFYIGICSFGVVFYIDKNLLAIPRFFGFSRVISCNSLLYRKTLAKKLVFSWKSSSLRV